MPELNALAVALEAQSVSVYRRLIIPFLSFPGSFKTQDITVRSEGLSESVQRWSLNFRAL